MRSAVGIFDSTQGGWLWKYEKKPEMGTSVIGTNSCCLGKGSFVKNSGQVRSK